MFYIHSFNILIVKRYIYYKLMCDFDSISDVIAKYSNFVALPIYLNGSKVNVVQVRITHSIVLHPTAM